MKKLSVFLLALLAVAVVVTPLLVIQPFRAQGARELAFALGLMRWSPWITLLAFVLIAYLVFRHWRESGWLMRGGFVLAILVAGIAVGGARFNIFERMFRPVTDSRFIAASEAKNDAKEMVLAVEIKGEARAYPVLALAYHHVLNDTLAGEPLVGTY